MSRGTETHSGRLHPLAKNLWRQLEDLGEADRRFVFNTLQSRLAPRKQLGNQEVAIAALQRFASACRAARASTADVDLPGWARKTLSKRNYNAFRDAQPDRNSLPSTTLIANAFEGRWAGALAAAGLGAAPNVLAKRCLQQGKAFDLDEVKRALRAWIAQVDPERPLVQAEYVAWIRRGSAPDSNETRFPTLPTMMRFFRTWAEALIELGELDRHPDVVAARHRMQESPRSEWAAGVVQQLDAGALPGSARSKESEDAEGWLRWMTVPLSRERQAGLEIGEWGILRAALIDRLASLGTYARVPGADGIKEALGGCSWPAAKLRAGLIDEGSRMHCSPTTRAFEADELFDALVSAANEIGRLPTQSEYGTLRRAADTRLPSEATIRVRLGADNTWDSALERLLAERPELRLAGEGA